MRALPISDCRVTEVFSTLRAVYRKWRGLSTVGVLNITLAAWTAGFQWWRSGDITRTQNVSEYSLYAWLQLSTHLQENSATGVRGWAYDNISG